MSDRATEKKKGERGAPDRRELRGSIVVTFSGQSPRRAALGLPPGKITEIGFNSFAGMTLDSFVSKRHFTITFAPPATFVLTDCGSSNGTFVDGERLRGSKRLPAGATVRFGDTIAHLQVTDDTADDDDPPPGMVGASPLFRLACAAIRDAALVDRPALILGETGTGKEVAARAIHALSRRKGRPFVVVNCAAIPETLIESVLFGHVKGAFSGADAERAGLFEAAEGGTIFLDEIGAASHRVQAALLRVLAEGRVLRVGAHGEKSINVRVIAATNADVKDTHLFRADLFERLAGCEVTLPPLRERIDDLLPLAEALSQARWGEPLPTLTAEAVETLGRYAWPGNIRELGRKLDQIRAALNGEAPIYRELVTRVLEQHAFTLAARQTGEETVRYWERKDLTEMIDTEWQAVFTAFNGDISSIAEFLRCHRKTVTRYLRRLGLLPRAND